MGAPPNRWEVMLMALLISILQLAAVLLELFVLVVSIFKTRGDAPKHKRIRRNP